MTYIATNNEFIWNVYIIEAELHIRQGHNGFDVIITNRHRTKYDFKNLNDYHVLENKGKLLFLEWLFDSIFNGKEKVIFEKDY